MSLSHLGKRALLSILMIWTVATLSFLLIHALPGDPVDMILGDQASNFDKASLRASLGLDQNLPKQYYDFQKNLVTLNWGQSLFSHRNIFKEISTHLPHTFYLAVTALLISVFISIPVGAIAAIHQYTAWSELLSLGCIFAISLPSFFLAPLMILFFCVSHHWLPIGGNETFLSVALPAATLSIGLSSALIQFTKTSFIEFISLDFVRVLRAKGAHPFRIYFVHVMKNALSPVVSIIGLQLASLLSGALIVESIFDWPGMGTLIYQAVQGRDYPLVQYCVLTTAIIYTLVNFSIDLIYPILQPRLRN